MDGSTQSFTTEQWLNCLLRQAVLFQETIRRHRKLLAAAPREEIGSHKATENRFRLLYAILSRLSVCEIDIRNSGGFGIVFYLKERFVLQFKPAGNPL